MNNKEKWLKENIPKIKEEVQKEREFIRDHLNDPVIEKEFDILQKLGVHYSRHLWTQMAEIKVAARFAFDWDLQENELANPPESNIEAIHDEGPEPEPEVE